MTTLEVCLCIGLAVALVAMVILGAMLPRRIASIVLAEHAKSAAEAVAAGTALRETLNAEVAAIVAPLRDLLAEREHELRWWQANTTQAAANEVERVVTPLHALLAWAFTETDGPYVWAVVRPAHATQQTAVPAPQVAPSPGSGPMTIMPPASAAPQPVGPAMRAAGIGRPRAQPRASGQTPQTPTGDGNAAPRSATLIGAGPSPAGALRSTPTLHAMPVVAPPTARTAPEILVEDRSEARREGAP